MASRSILPLLWLAVSIGAAASDAAAQESSPEIVRAREAFVEGASLARDMRWGDALGRFEASARLRPHAGTSYNIGICQRALGQYVRARESFARALKQNEAERGAALSESMAVDTATFLAEMERVIATLDVTLEPPTASVTVDGRPLERTEPQGGLATTIAGTLPPGAGEAPPSGRFRVILDPGAHVFVLSRKGFANVVHRETVSPGSHGVLPLVLARLPGTLQVTSSELRAVVTVDGLDVGMAPISIVRPAGSYRVVVRKKGFVTYETHAELSSGERVDLRAVLRPQEVSLTQRWWFWTAVGVVVVGTAAGTWLATRPEPERPPVDGGGLGWAVRVP